jgi:RNA polymerase primary sigma factor
MRELKINKSITNRDSQSIERYLQEIGKIDLLTDEQEIVLAKRVKKGDRRALETLVKSNLRFVVSVAKQYQNSSLSLNDLINEGNLGILKAAQKFDETKGFKFISYAVWWIRQSIIQALSENSRLVRLPLNKIGGLSKINKAFREFEQYNEREPTPEELAEMLDLEVEQVSASMGISSRHISLNMYLGNDGDPEGNTLLDVLEDKDSPNPMTVVDYKQSLSIEVARSLEILDDREQNVLKMFFGIGYDTEMSLEDIGERLGLTRERARQIKDKALHKLRDTWNKSSNLKVFLG